VYGNRIGLADVSQDGEEGDKYVHGLQISSLLFFSLFFFLASGAAHRAYD